MLGVASMRMACVLQYYLDTNVCRKSLFIEKDQDLPVVERNQTNLNHELLSMVQDH